MFRNSYQVTSSLPAKIADEISGCYRATRNRIPGSIPKEEVKSRKNNPEEEVKSRKKNNPEEEEEEKSRKKNNPEEEEDGKFQKNNNPNVIEEENSEGKNPIGGGEEEKSSRKNDPEEKEEEKSPNKKKKNNPFLGLLYTFLACFFILQTSVMVKKLTYLDPGQLSMVRNVGVCVGCLPIAVYCSEEGVMGPRRHWPMLFLRALCGATALYLNLLAYRYLPLAEASVILSTTPSVVTIFARVYLREPCGLVQVAAILLTVSGMAVSVRLPDLLMSTSSNTSSDDAHHLTGIGCALGCVLLLSVNMVSLRKMLDVHYSVILLYFGVLGALENALLTGVLAKEGFQLAACGWDTVQVALIGILGFAGHCFFTLAVQVEAAGVVSTLKSSIDIVLSMLLQVLFFSRPPDAWSVGGAGLVLLSVAVIGTRKWLMSLPEEAAERRRWRLLLV